MKYYTAVACLSLVLGTSSCVSNKYVVLAPDIPKLRIASVEHRFTNSDACRVAALAYNFKINHTSTLPSDANPHKDLYTFRKKPWFGETREVRFVVGPEGAGTGKRINYLEISQVAGTENGKAISDFVDMLKAQGYKVLLPPMKDFEVNNKTAWRAILYVGSEKSRAMKYKMQGAELFDFGIIINPPYPP